MVSVTSVLGKAAEEYAKSGWYIFPLKPRGKEPLTAHGLNDATNNIETIRRWWEATPEANVGLNVGKSRLVVFDLDMGDGEDGISAWAEIEGGFGIEQTSTSFTPTGGQHKLFANNIQADLRNTQDRPARGIDIRANGGYIVLPPSIHPNGKPYQWSDSTSTIAPLPQALVDYVLLPQDHWQLETAEDALKPQPPVEWLVSNTVEAGSISIWFGAPGSMKSLILADLCINVATGGRFLRDVTQAGGMPVIAAPFLWVDFDNGKRRTRERFGAFTRTYSALGAPFFYTSMPDGGFDAGNTQHVADMAGRMIANGIRVLVIDNLITVSGGRKENEAEMQIVMDGIKWLREETGAAIILIHHQTKQGGGRASGRKGESLRGHSCIEAACDSVWYVERDGEQGDNLSVIPTKVRGAPVNPFGAKFTFESNPDKSLRLARFFGNEVTPPAQKRENGIKAKILAALKAGGKMSGAAIKKSVGGRGADIDGVLFDLVKHGDIASEGSGAFHKYFLL